MMKNTGFVRALAVGALLLPVVAMAHWQGKGELGAAQATANTGASSTTWNAKFDLANEYDRWKHAFGASTVYSSARAEASQGKQNPQDETAAKRWEAHEQTNYNFSTHAFWFGALRYEHDSVGSFLYQEMISTGVGYKFIDSDVTTLIGQAGAGYKRFEKRVVTDTDKKTDSNAILTAGVEYKHKLTANTVFLDKLMVESGSDNTLAQNDLALQVKMSDKLALALGHQLRYYSKPGPRKFPPNGGNYAKTDRLLTVNLVYEFK